MIFDEKCWERSKPAANPPVRSSIEVPVPGHRRGDGKRSPMIYIQTRARTVRSLGLGSTASSASQARARRRVLRSEGPPSQSHHADGRRSAPTSGPGGGAGRLRGRDFPPGRSEPGEGGADREGCSACDWGWVGVSCCGRVGVESCGRPPHLLLPPSLRHDAGDRQAAHRGDAGGQPAGEVRAAVGRSQAWRRRGRRCPPRPRWAPPPNAPSLRGPCREPRRPGRPPAARVGLRR